MWKTNITLLIYHINTCINTCLQINHPAKFILNVCNNVFKQSQGSTMITFEYNYL